MSQGRILAIDDELNIRHLIKNEFSMEGFQVTTAKSGEEGLRLFSEHDFDVVLLDVKLPKMDGLEVLKRLKQNSKPAEVIMITGYGDIESAIGSMKLGARDYVTKPFKLRELLTLVRNAVNDKEKSTDAGKQLTSPQIEDGVRFIWCPSQAMQEIYDLMQRVAPTDKTILIQGETGVGKDVLAQQIHLKSARKNGPFVTVDCGLLNQNLAESELYGHCKGAFSGATDKKQGLVEKSHKGTLFLDEIGNIELELQKKFLRFLDTGRYRRVGQLKEARVDTRIILATNLDMLDAMQKGTLRKDLFYRMDVFYILLPALRDHPEDISPLAQHFLEADASKDSPKKISTEAIEVLAEYPWPGNVRELRSTINKAMILTETDIITSNDLPAHIQVGKRIIPPCPKRLKDVEKEHILAVLAETGGNQSKAAEILGINRKTLYKKIHQYKLFS
jgi:DNA-binding NtrC family response regulator